MDIVERAFIYSREIAEETGIQNVLDAVVDRTCRLTRTAEVRLCLGPGSEGAVELTLMPSTEDVQGEPLWVIAENRSAVLPDLQDCARCGYAQARSHLHFLLVPVKTNASEYGGLCVFREPSAPFTAREIRAIELLAGVAAASIAGAVNINHAGRQAAAELHGLLTRSLGSIQDRIEAVQKQASLENDRLLMDLIGLRAGLNRAHNKVEMIFRKNHAALADGPDLTRREMQVLEMIASGATNREIAVALAVRLPTVKSHVHSILHKLNALNRRQAVSLSRRMGLIDINKPE